MQTEAPVDLAAHLDRRAGSYWAWADCCDGPLPWWGGGGDRGSRTGLPLSRPDCPTDDTSFLLFLSIEPSPLYPLYSDLLVDCEAASLPAHRLQLSDSPGLMMPGMLGMLGLVCAARTVEASQAGCLSGCSAEVNGMGAVGKGIWRSHHRCSSCRAGYTTRVVYTTC